MKKVIALAAGLSVILAACGSPKDEKTAFIDATVEATCRIFQAENIFDPALESEAKEIYKSYGFDADDDAMMEELTARYENDEEVQSSIMKGLEECGGDLFSGLEDAVEDAVQADDAMEGDAMEGDAMEGDAMEGDAMEGDAMEGDAMEAEPAQ